MKKTFIIAEAGINHNGKISLAKKLVNLAKKVGADAVKFQTFIPENVMTKKCELANYQKKNIGKNISMIEMIKKNELKYKDFIILKKYCKKKKIEFLSSPFDLESLDFLLNVLKLKKIKIPSGEITNYQLLKKAAQNKVKIILSTGMCNMKEIENAVNFLKKNKLSKKNISLLHCITNYPAKFNELNLRSILKIKQKFNCKVGYSDHSTNIEASIAAVAIGAKIIEKHITIDKKLPGPDHIASLNEKEFKALVQGIRNIEIALGDTKKITSDEKKNISIVRKSLVAKKNILKGEFFTENNLTSKRPLGGICASNFFKYIGKKSKKNYQKDDFI